LNVLYTILLVIGLIVAILFALLVFFTGKGDAMSGGGSVRTTFKGKASFDDIMSKMTLYLGISFMAIMLGLDVISNQIEKNPATKAADSAPANPAPANAEPGPVNDVPAVTPDVPATTGGGETGTETPATTGQ
jgi:protein translocase SecG subunit